MHRISRVWLLVLIALCAAAPAFAETQEGDNSVEVKQSKRTSSGESRSSGNSDSVMLQQATSTATPTDSPDPTDEPDETDDPVDVFSGVSRTPRAPRTPRSAKDSPDPVVVEAAASDDDLPSTGANILGLGAWAFALISVGLILMAVRTRDRFVSESLPSAPWGDEPLIGW